MDKKNTMLLTVIAVATLLVAVVGATFAYFNVTTSGNTSATTVTATTEKTGVLTASGGEQALTLNLTATHMAQTALIDGTPLNYFATKSGTPETVSISGEESPSGSDIYTEIGKIALTDASENTKYHCQVLYNVTVDFKDATGLTDKDDEKSQVTTGDGKLYLKTEGTGVEVSIKNDSAGAPDESGVDHINHELNSLLANNTKFWVTYDFDGTSNTNASGTISAAFAITNRNGLQNYLADKQIKVTLTPDNNSGKLTCNIVKDED